MAYGALCLDARCYWWAATEVVYGLLCQDLVGGLGPDEVLAAVVPTVDEGPDLDHEVSDGGKRATVDGLAFDDGEPDLDQVQPGSRRRGEVHLDARVRR
jgi:hypothetical protein